MRISALFGRVPAFLALLWVLFITTSCIEEWKGVDHDGDGWSAADGDCWDSNDSPPPNGLSSADIYPGAEDVPYDGIDADCAGNDDYDIDGDRYVTDQAHMGKTTLGVLPPSHLGYGDCDDNLQLTYPGAPDTWYDGVDSDCAGNDDYDQDYDGYASEDYLDGTDCNDDDIDINPGAAETCDGNDTDCNGEIDDGTAADTIWYADSDGDGYGDPDVTETGCDTFVGYITDNNTDCDDSNADVNPGAIEICDDVDNDCDGNEDEDDAVDATEWFEDLDEDGFGDANSSLVACDAPAGHVVSDEDCDDTNAEIHPDAQEVCDPDNVDEDCDDLSDDDDPDADLSTMKPFYEDADGDTYGDASSYGLACDSLPGHVENSTDCDDTNDAVHPGAREDCDAIDNDCDPSNDAVGSTWYADVDEDDHGDLAATTTKESCDDETTGCNDGDSSTDCWSLTADDCDDVDASVNPSAVEVCDVADTDEDCDGLSDDDDSSVTGTSTFYTDSDGDSYGDPSASVDVCDPASDQVTDDTDCDDTNSSINPGATEVCDSSDIDQDCDGLVDDDDPDVDTTTMSTYFADSDGDGYGDVDSTTDACDQPSGFASNDQDCDDTDGAINPGATEVCDTANVDEDCDGLADDADASVDTSTQSTFYEDGDSDGYGDAASTTDACDQPSGFASNDQDCDDTDGAINPGATEVCDTFDNDCDGDIDDDDISLDGSTLNTFYADTDSDGYGDSASTGHACDAPSGYVADATDCNDSDNNINPAATEICDAADVDEDCNGLADDADTGVDTGTHDTFYADTDLDGYGDPANTTGACDEPSGYVADNTDCDDGAANTNPAATEICDEFDADEDCDGLSDDDDSSVDTGTYFTWYADADSDGSGDASVTTQACDEPPGYVDNDNDCDDTTPAIGGSDWYADTDGDGYGDASVGQTACSQPTGYVADSTDCDDTDDEVNPGMSGEYYWDVSTQTLYGSCTDTVDTNCDGYTDAADTDACTDSDGNGEYDGAQLIFACDPIGYGYDYALCVVGGFSDGSGSATAWEGEATYYTSEPFTSILSGTLARTPFTATFGGNTYTNVNWTSGGAAGVTGTYVRSLVSALANDGTSAVDTADSSTWEDMNISWYCSVSASTYCYPSTDQPNGYGFEYDWDGGSGGSAYRQVSPPAP